MYMCDVGLYMGVGIHAHFGVQTHMYIDRVNVKTKIMFVPDRRVGSYIGTSQEAKYIECWPCPPLGILLNKYFPAG
jgi:hypothetical protein